MELSAPQRIQNNILNLIDRINLFDGLDYDFSQILEKIEKKEQKKNKDV